MCEMIILFFFLLFFFFFFFLPLFLYRGNVKKTKKKGLKEHWQLKFASYPKESKWEGKSNSEDFLLIVKPEEMVFWCFSLGYFLKTTPYNRSIWWLASTKPNITCNIERSEWYSISTNNSKKQLVVRWVNQRNQFINATGLGLEAHDG